MTVQSYHIVQVLGGRVKRPSLWKRLQSWLLRSLMLYMLCPAPSAKALDTDKVAHLGVSYALTMGTYGVFKAVLNSHCRLDNDKSMGECQLSEGERLAAGVFAVATTTIIGLAKEMSDGRMDKNDILYNGIGSGAALFSIKVFGF